MIKTDPFVFTGSQDEMLTCYVSKGKNILRKKTSLDGERVRKDPAFKGFRNSCGRMKLASPIAAALYAMVPAKHRKYPLYRVLTGAALKMIKLGVETDIIKASLKKEHIDPLIASFLQARRTVVAPRPTGSSLFSYGQLSTSQPVRNNRRIRARRTVRLTVAALPVTSRKGNVRFMPGVAWASEREMPDLNYIPGLVYLGRLEEAPKLKMYQREGIGLVIGFNAEIMRSTPF